MRQHSHERTGGAISGHLVVWILFNEPNDDVRGDETCEIPPPAVKYRAGNFKRGSAVHRQQQAVCRCILTRLRLL